MIEAHEQYPVPMILPGSLPECINMCLVKPYLLLNIQAWTKIPFLV